MTKRRQHRPDQIIRKIAEGHKLLAIGPSMTRSASICGLLSRRGIARSHGTTG